MTRRRFPAAGRPVAIRSSVQAACRASPLRGGAGRRRGSAGTATRPCASQPSSNQVKGSPPRCRTSETCQRARPTPATGSGEEGAQPIRHRVTAEDGAVRGSSLDLRHRRSSRAVVPPSSAASWRRRVAVMPTRVTSHTTAASAPCRSASSITASASSSLPAST